MVVCLSSSIWKSQPSACLLTAQHKLIICPFFADSFSYLTPSMLVISRIPTLAPFTFSTRLALRTALGCLCAAVPLEELVCTWFQLRTMGTRQMPYVRARPAQHHVLPFSSVLNPEMVTISPLAFRSTYFTGFLCAIPSPHQLFILLPEFDFSGNYSELVTLT